MKHSVLFRISVLPALLVMPAIADTVTTRQVISENTTYNNLVAENIASTTANNGGVFYMQDVPGVTLLFDGETLFVGNSLNDGGMGGVIGNGWLSSISGSGYTQGGKIVFDGKSVFNDNATNNENGGGAIFNYGNGTATAPDVLFLGATTFSGNKVTASSSSVFSGGGAINHRGGMIVFADRATFNGNESASRGGAIIAGGDMIFNGAAEFTGNTAGTNGGAIAILSGDVEFEKAATFSNNSATGASAIFLDESDSNLSFADSVNFTGNTGVGTLLNNNSTGTVLFGNGANFTGNTNNLNGALVNSGTVSLTGGDLIFTGNTGSNGGGLKNAGTVTVNTNGNILFTSNTTSSSAGALDNGGSAALAAKTISFAGNSSNAGYGGAIFNAGDMNVLGAENIFVGNIARDTGTTKSGGGAIHNRGNTGTAALIVGTETGTNLFESNKSSAHGGAIVSRAFDGAGQDAEITVNGATRFVNNTAALNGGAIWNAVAESGGSTGTSKIVFNNNVAFVNNHAGGMGGAIYNNDTITFNGDATFRGNTANGVGNDIYNDGTVTFNGNATIVGGITGSGTLNIASDAVLDIGMSSVSQGAIVLDGTMLATLRAADNAQINVANEGGFTGDGVIKLSFDNPGTYKVFGNQMFNSVDISSPIYDLTWNGGDVIATIKSVSDIASQNDLSDDVARTVAGVASSTSSPLNDLSVLIQNSLASGTSDARSNVEEAVVAINPETESVSQSIGMGIQRSVAGVAAERMGLTALGRNGGDVRMLPGGIWAQGLYNKSKHSDAFNAYTRGIAAGIDGIFNEVLTLGAGYMFGHSDIGASARNTEIDSHSVFVYGQYKPSNWYMNAVMNYTTYDYSERGSALGLAVSSDYDMDAFGANVAFGYDFIGGITPEVSLRYIYLDSVNYTNSMGIRNKIDSSNYLTASLGTRYGFDVLMDNGWVLRPALHYALKYDLVSDDNRVTVAIPGVSAYSLSGDGLSRIANEIGVEIGMMYGPLNLALSYDIEARADYTSQTGRAKFRYEF
ncbi:MAG: autotransporter domain-containing protein [Alphaproteobacteria bacterium]|nr:autotransporter domain-containing protein [Alphaproteobacteria bacterium]